MGNCKDGSKLAASEKERPKPGRQRGAQVSGTKSGRKRNTHLTPEDELTTDVKKLVREAMPLIVTGLLTGAKEGSLPHIKLLLELFPEAGGEVNEAEMQSVAELLLRELNGEGEATADPSLCSG